MALFNLARLDLPKRLHVERDIRGKHRKSPTVILLHGLGGSSKRWHLDEKLLPFGARVMTIDLLGFGDSPKPPTASYNVRVQARSLAFTLFRLRLRRRVIIVGHSLGSLVAIELAKRYPRLVKGLILCSPPIYRTSDKGKIPVFTSDAFLKKMYARAGRAALSSPEKFIRFAQTASKAKLTPGGFRLDDETIGPYVRALNASIIDQTSYQDVQHLQMPVEIIYGAFDPFIVRTNLKKLTKAKSNISITRVAAAHEISAAYHPAIENSVGKIIKIAKQKN